MGKEKQKMELEEWGPFEEVYNSLLERGFTQEDIDILVKDVILKRDGGMSEEKALVLVSAELSGSDMEEDDDDEVEDCEGDELDHQKQLDLTDWIEIGDAFFEEGLFHEAIRFYERALNEDPDLIQIWKKVGHSYLKIGEFDEACLCYSVAHRPVIDVKDLFEKKEDHAEMEDA